MCTFKINVTLKSLLIITDRNTDLSIATEKAHLDLENPHVQIITKERGTDHLDQHWHCNAKTSRNKASKTNKQESATVKLKFE